MQVFPAPLDQANTRCMGYSERADSIAEIVEPERNFADLAAQQHDALLQSVFLGASHPDRIALDAGGELEPTILDDLDNALGQRRLQAVAHCHNLLELVGADFLGGLVQLQE